MVLRSIRNWTPFFFLKIRSHIIVQVGLGHTVYPRLDSNSFSCLSSFPSARIIDMNYHTWLLLGTFASYGYSTKFPAIYLLRDILAVSSLGLWKTKAWTLLHKSLTLFLVDLGKSPGWNQLGHMVCTCWAFKDTITPLYKLANSSSLCLHQHLALLV